ncbi:type II toxin-antitoxin system PemK/MazF family toxin [Persicitalea sp.]|uniref:type II toxin-antitoxin system PemK/MazF family toxin n=1 Tax=Persicitalea sp. TaxID=3100273 RepID=UPI00359366F0
MAKGDVLLITFPFTNLSGSKLRPAVVLAETSLDLTVCFTTTQTAWSEPTDMLLAPNIANGLKKPSLVRTNKIATLDRLLAKGLIGKLSTIDIANLDAKLKIVLDLS